jgi:hypothetical protein
MRLIAASRKHRSEKVHNSVECFAANYRNFVRAVRRQSRRADLLVENESDYNFAIRHSAIGRMRPAGGSCRCEQLATDRPEIDARKLLAAT